jgi:hypothetical protein
MFKKFGHLNFEGVSDFDIRISDLSTNMGVLLTGGLITCKRSISW